MIVINALPGVTAGTPFTVKGSMSGIGKPAQMYFSDAVVKPAAPTGLQAHPQTNGSVALSWAPVADTSAQPFPAGSSITATSFLFLHPAVSAGVHTLLVSDGVHISPAASFIAQSANNTKMLRAGDPPIYDSHGTRWALTSGKRIAINTITDLSTWNATMLLYHNGQVYYENAASLWFTNTKSKPGTWVRTPMPDLKG